MELLLFITFWLFSGQVYCLDVTAYTGGSVIINWPHDLKYINHTKYLCRLEQEKCSNKTISKGVNTWADGEKIMVFNDFKTGFYSVLIRNISDWDAGTYRSRIEQVTQIPDATLKVKNDPCCGMSLIQTAHQGQNITLNCTHPMEYKNKLKYVFKVDNHSIHAVISPATQPESRYSLLEGTQANVFSMEISDVTVEDGGLYLCGAQEETSRIPNFPLFCEIQLHVTSTASIAGSSDFIIILIITAVCVCATLLLIGGSSLVIYRLRRYETPGSTFSSSSRRKTVNSNEVHHSPYYEEVADHTQATTQKPKAPHTSPNTDPRPAEPALDFYSMALLPLRTTETSVVYATVQHSV